MSAASVALYNRWRDLMRSWGFTVLEAAGCDTQSASSRPANPSGMFLEHHDASSALSGNWGSLATILAGRVGIPPRLGNLQFARDGQAMITCKNVANHGGLGGPLLGVPLNDVNVHSCGAEVANNGLGEPYSPALTRALIHGEAAWAIVTGRTADYVRGHKEWAPGRKFDPALDMNTRRAQVAAVIAGGAPAPSPLLESDMYFAQTPDGTVWKITDYDVSPEPSIYRYGALSKARNGTLVKITNEERLDNQGDADARRARLLADIAKAAGGDVDEAQIVAGLIPAITTALAAKVGASREEIAELLKGITLKAS